MPKLLLLLFSFLCCAGLPCRAQGEPAEIGFVHEFGAPGSTGSFRARFSREGGGLVWLQTMDHFVSLEARRRNEHTPGDYLLLANSDGGDHALRLLLAGRSEAFPVDPATATWTVDRLGDDALRFTLDSTTGLVLEKVLRHDPAGRGFTLEVALRNVSSAATGGLDLELTGPALVSSSDLGLFGTQSLSLAVAQDGTTVQVTPSTAGAAQSLAADPALLSFAGSTSRFFGSFLWPHDAPATAALERFAVDSLPRRDDPSLDVKAFSSTRVRYGLELAIPAAGAETRLAYGLYLGPKSYRVFETLPDPERFAPILDVDLDPPCCGITVPGGRPMAKLLLRLLGWFHDLVGNWGVAIIMLTILVRGLLAPLNFRMQKSMRGYAGKMAVLKPKLDALREKHGDDRQAYQQAMIALQREHKLMPPLGGCLPILLTMPIYLGLFTALRTAYDLRHQPFVAWIDDLSQPDALATLSFWPHHFNLLPLVWIALFCWMSLRQPLPSDPQQRQMQSMMRFMPILFGVMLYNYASALMLYMVTSMVWSVIESAIVKRILGPMDPNVAAMAPTPM